MIGSLTRISLGILTVFHLATGIGQLFKVYLALHELKCKAIRFGLNASSFWPSEPNLCPHNYCHSQNVILFGQYYVDEVKTTFYFLAR